MFGPGYEDVPFVQPSFAPAMQAMQHLGNVKYVKIKEQVRFLEAITAALGAEVEMANKYDIVDGDTGQQLFYAVEQTDCCTRQLRGGCECAPWSLDIMYAGDPIMQVPTFHLERPCTLTCCCLNRPVLTVTDGNGTEIGKVVDPFRFCNMTFHVQDPDDNDIVTVDGGCCQWGLCCPMPCGPCAKVNFEIQSNDGAQVGEIQKKISCWKWLAAPDVDNYKIKFGQVQHPAAKALIIALAIFMDIKYFSDNPRDDDGGLISELSSFSD